MRTRTALALALLAAVVAVGSVAALAGGTVLTVTDTETGERYLTVPVDEGTTVALEYTHSVEQSRVYEAYAVRDGRLEATRMEFESYGWGLPSGADVTEENGTFVYDPPGSLQRLTVKPGRVANHTLHVGPRSYDLVALTDARAVDLAVTHRSGLAAATDRLTDDRRLDARTTADSTRGPLTDRRTVHRRPDHASRQR